MGWRGFGFVHHSRTVFCRAVPNLRITIRNFFIAVLRFVSAAQVRLPADGLRRHRLRWKEKNTSRSACVRDARRAIARARVEVGASVKNKMRNRSIYRGYDCEPAELRTRAP